MQVKVKDGQTLIDIAIQQYGDASAVAVLAYENGLDITSDVAAGTMLNYAQANIVNQAVSDYMTNHKIAPKTGAITI